MFSLFLGTGGLEDLVVLRLLDLNGTEKDLFCSSLQVGDCWVLWSHEQNCQVFQR